MVKEVVGTNGDDVSISVLGVKRGRFEAVRIIEKAEIRGNRRVIPKSEGKNRRLRVWEELEREKCGSTRLGGKGGLG